MTPEHSRQADEMASKVVDAFYAQPIHKESIFCAVQDAIPLPQMLAVIEAARVLCDTDNPVDAYKANMAIHKTLADYDAAIAERKK